MTCGMQKYQGVINELTKTVSLAKPTWILRPKRCTAVERQAGPDLAELRILNETPSQRQRPAAPGRRDRNRTAHLSRIGQFEPGTPEPAEGAAGRSGPTAGQPGRLLESQPALRRLKDGLVDAAAAHGTTVGQHVPRSIRRSIGGPRLGTGNQPATAR